MTNQTIQYKGYTATLTQDADTKHYAGKVIGIEHLILFEGATLEDASNNFKETIDNYPQYCAEIGYKPDPPPSEIMVPIKTELYAKATSIAENKGQTPTGVVNQAVEALVAQY
jgi:predicted HicB family RNase H-like nuclease